ncbi:integrase [Candidatus Halocynthiibacter alkanivorans]|uniref:integrase n=1 Tax=Candidatus Halocynthiibacter alkanivorans TaxID=2267619 RepID=UPI000DF3EAB9|nr:integrase [Candidatus Halocynthiibacter alkanivorans]
MKTRKIIGAEKYDIHALRYTTASELALAGCSDKLIAAVTGQSIEMVVHYTATVRQKVRAIEAQGKRK